MKSILKAFAPYELSSLHTLDRFLRGYKLGALMTMKVSWEKMN